MSTAEAYYREVKGLSVEESPILGREHHEVIELLEDYHRGMTQVKNKGLLHSVSERFSDDKFITNVCLSYDHSFGLMTEEERKKVVFDCKEWMRAIKNNEPY